MHEAIVIDARCAGSPTIFLLAREEYEVFLLDRAIFPSDMPFCNLYVIRTGMARLKWCTFMEKPAAAGRSTVLKNDRPGQAGRRNRGRSTGFSAEISRPGFGGSGNGRKCAILRWLPRIGRPTRGKQPDLSGIALLGFATPPGWRKMFARWQRPEQRRSAFPVYRPKTTAPAEQPAFIGPF
jgi:hypothetical protein